MGYIYENKKRCSHTAKKEAEKLRQKIQDLKYKIKALNKKAMAGDCEAIRQQSIYYQKIEVTENRLNGAFGRPENAAIQPHPLQLHIR